MDNSAHMTQPTIHIIQKKAPPDGFEKGKLFEEYITQLFNQDSFKVSKWRKSEKFEDKMRLTDCVNPDLEMIFGRYKEYRFAIECKWRRDFRGGYISWARPKQIRAYQAFENNQRIPVFIAIGIGGDASKPDRLYVTPLRNIEMNQFVCEEDLIPYTRKPTRKFFYDPRQLKLF